MVEEAAGTGMYESKRDETQKLLKNKDSKMKEINSVNIKYFNNNKRNTS